ncbi:MAG: nuclear transport factor 2 family protein [Solirubrobacterales bacterium]
MSQENVEIVRAALDAYNRGDFEGLSRFAGPDFTFDWSRSIGPQRGVYGIDELSKLNIAEQFETARTEPEEFIEVGDQVITPLVGHFRGRDGIEVTARFTYLWSVRDGAVARVTLYQEREEALEAAGLRE